MTHVSHTLLMQVIDEINGWQCKDTCYCNSYTWSCHLALLWRANSMQKTHLHNPSYMTDGWYWNKAEQRPALCEANRIPTLKSEGPMLPQDRNPCVNRSTMLRRHVQITIAVSIVCPASGVARLNHDCLTLPTHSAVVVQLAAFLETSAYEYIRYEC